MRKWSTRDAKDKQNEFCWFTFVGVSATGYHTYKVECRHHQCVCRPAFRQDGGRCRNRESVLLHKVTQNASQRNVNDVPFRSRFKCFSGTQKYCFLDLHRVNLLCRKSTCILHESLFDVVPCSVRGGGPLLAGPPVSGWRSLSGRAVHVSQRLLRSQRRQHVRQDWR